MSLFHGKETRLGYIIGKIIQSGNCTDVIGGTLTNGTFDGEGSGLITFAPPFISAPTINVSIQAGLEGGGAVLTASNYFVSVTGVTVGTCYVQGTQGSGLTIGFTALGLQKM